MSEATDLRQRAQAFRDKQRPQAQAPVERGRVLASIPRMNGEELHITWDEYEGYNYLSLRVWRRGQDGQAWPIKEKGLTIKVRELGDVAIAMAEALELAEQEGDRRGEGQGQSRQSGGGYRQRGETPPSWGGDPGPGDDDSPF